MAAHVRKLAGRSIDFRETFADLTRNFRAYPAGKLLNFTRKFQNSHKLTSVGSCFCNDVFLRQHGCRHTHGSSFQLPVGKPPLHKTSREQNNFRDPIRRTFAEVNAKTKRSSPSYLDTRTFRTTFTQEVCLSVQVCHVKNETPTLPQLPTQTCL